MFWCIPQGGVWKQTRCFNAGFAFGEFEFQPDTIPELKINGLKEKMR